MNAEWQHVQRVYLVLLLLHTLAASFIWGINTLFLLDAGLSNAQAFGANAFFTAGMLLFEIPTGVIADVRGRRLSYLLGTFVLTLSTLVYLWLWRIHAPFWAWAITSMFLGLGFTFFSGAVQAWLVDALKATGFDGKVETVFARGEIAEGMAMLSGSVAGGYIAQLTNLGVPYLVRAAILGATFVVAFVWMRDVGFEPKRTSVGSVLSGAMQYGLRNPPVRWLMIANIFTGGASIYAFYAMQPYLLQLYGNPNAYGVAGVAAAIVGGAQIGGGLLVPWLARVFRRRMSVVLTSVIVSTAVLALIAVLPHFWSAIVLLVIWGLVFATVTPIQQAFINDLIPSQQRATVLSFDSLMGSGGGVFIQPLLGRAADIGGYPLSYAWTATVQTLAIPFVWLSRREEVKTGHL